MSHSANLFDRSLFRLSGADSVDFLHNLVTCDVVKLREGDVTFGGLLTPQGKVLFDFHIMREADGFLFDVASGARDDVMKRLKFYKLRAAVDIEPDDDRQVYALWGDDVGGTDGRRPEMGTRAYSASHETNSTIEDWNRHRLHVGIPLSGVDFDLGDVFAHDTLMDQFVGGGVDFSKGCYVGQEVVSRMKHRDSARNRFVKVKSGTDLPQKGVALIAAEKRIGTMGSAVGKDGLALVRVDKVGKALDAGEPITAEDAPVTLELPEFATFGWGS
ncbi:YgfZ/GcvT domain-containing protein [Pseudahrensia aquimaris]|uniref:YgfZ/GcvT domain-containing protein n=1 Tax=Pseudahrensia aquimaris TaxID=744461 RepID=A0ABW3FE64_9HYPH